MLWDQRKNCGVGRRWHEATCEEVRDGIQYLGAKNSPRSLIETRAVGTAVIWRLRAGEHVNSVRDETHRMEEKITGEGAGEGPRILLKWDTAWRLI